MYMFLCVPHAKISYGKIIVLSFLSLQSCIHFAVSFVLKSYSAVVICYPQLHSTQMCINIYYCTYMSLVLVQVIDVLLLLMCVVHTTCHVNWRSGDNPRAVHTVIG